VRLKGVSIVLMLAIAGAGCRHRVRDAPVPLPAHWDYCWWTVIRSTLPVDSVAARFRLAFVTVGLYNIHWTQRGDTIWVRGGPEATTYGAAFWGRATAFSQGDSTHFRLFAAIVPPAGGWPPSMSASSSLKSPLPLCDTIARAAALRWIRRAGDPGVEEDLPVWSRVP
jgi:hypothetical protein